MNTIMMRNTTSTNGHEEHPSNDNPQHKLKAFFGRSRYARYTCSNILPDGLCDSVSGTRADFEVTLVMDYVTLFLVREQILKLNTCDMLFMEP